MPEIEPHPFGYFLPENAEILIIGSFPCIKNNDYGDWFYSSSGKNDFWKLLSDVYNMPVETKSKKIEICQKHKIAITDIGGRIERIKGNCSDSNLKIHEINTIGIEKCLIPSIRNVYFTSKFVEKHFLKHYPKVDITCITLLSPSPAANRYIARLDEFKTLIKSGEITSAYQFRLRKYREHLLNDN